MPTKKITLYALLCAIGLTLGFFESTVFAFAVIPGGKIGLANIVTMVAFCLFSFGNALGFGLVRSLLSALLYGGMTSFFYSGAGTFLSLLFMYLTKKILKNRVSEVGISVVGALFFNIGQLTVCALVLNSIDVFRYFPALGIISSLAGAVTGTISKQLFKYINQKEQNYENGDRKLWK